MSAGIRYYVNETPYLWVIVAIDMLLNDDSADTGTITIDFVVFAL